jgi:hypothetical protein
MMQRWALEVDEYREMVVKVRKGLHHANADVHSRYPLPDPKRTYVIDTDWSIHGISAILSQVDSPECLDPKGQKGEDVIERGGARPTEKVIAYASRALKKSEKNYGSPKGELLAFMFGLRKFRQYVAGRPFFMGTDHAALQWIRTKDLDGTDRMMQRWALEVDEYREMVVKVRKGLHHANADVHSRYPLPLSHAHGNLKDHQSRQRSSRPP